MMLASLVDGCIRQAGSQLHAVCLAPADTGGLAQLRARRALRMTIIDSFRADYVAAIASAVEADTCLVAVGPWTAAGAAVDVAGIAAALAARAEAMPQETRARSVVASIPVAVVDTVWPQVPPVSSPLAAEIVLAATGWPGLAVVVVQRALRRAWAPAPVCVRGPAPEIPDRVVSADDACCWWGMPVSRRALTTTAPAPVAGELATVLAAAAGRRQAAGLPALPHALGAGGRAAVVRFATAPAAAAVVIRLAAWPPAATAISPTRVLLQAGTAPAAVLIAAVSDA